MTNQKNINFFAGMKFFGSYIEDKSLRRLMNEASKAMVTKVTIAEDSFGRPEARIHVGDQFTNITLSRDSYIPMAGEYSNEILVGAELRFLRKQGSEALQRLWLKAPKAKEKAPEKEPKDVIQEAGKASVIEGLFGK